MSDAEDFGRTSPQRAQQAINQMVLGQPPPSDMVHIFSVGLKKDLKTFEREYFRSTSFVVSEETFGSTFKIIEAYYGGGKTHYLRAVERCAHENNFASAFINLSKDSCPLTRFDLVYLSVAENLTIPVSGGGVVRGLGEVIKHWCSHVSDGEEEPVQVLTRSLDAMGEPPLVSMKLAFRQAVLAYSSGDHWSFEQALVYLTGGKVSPDLRRVGILQPIDSKSGSLALRSLAFLVKKMRFSGFILIMDEGDRSLSIASVKERTIASNNLVQLINETAQDRAWPSSLMLYSIPSWANFHEAFGGNQALIQRTEGTGFPMVPPAPRITLDDREKTHEDKVEFCVSLGRRLTGLFQLAYGTSFANEIDLEDVGRRVAESVLETEYGSTYRRLFVQSYLSALYVLDDGEGLSDTDIGDIVGKQASSIAGTG